MYLVGQNGRIYGGLDEGRKKYFFSIPFLGFLILFLGYFILFWNSFPFTWVAWRRKGGRGRGVAVGGWGCLQEKDFR